MLVGLHVPTDFQMYRQNSGYANAHKYKLALNLECDTIIERDCYYFRDD